MTIIATDTTPRFWPASLNCYNNGGLVGQWVDCTDAADVTLHQLPRAQVACLPDAKRSGAWMLRISP